MSESKRKRIKLLSLDCGSTFNSDYKLKHEHDVHKGKKLRYNILVHQFVAANVIHVCMYVIHL